MRVFRNLKLNWCKQRSLIQIYSDALITLFAFAPQNLRILFEIHKCWWDYRCCFVWMENLTTVILININQMQMSDGQSRIAIGHDFCFPIFLRRSSWSSCFATVSANKITIQSNSNRWSFVRIKRTYDFLFPRKFRGQIESNGRYIINCGQKRWCSVIVIRI